ncbi:MAG TPA: hypothetical protein VGR82_17590 [Methylomirabilota bacterium]|jgi:hypothetical protein|nr:hypothetical protein [Methylomirabilota bacterium]
MGEPAIVRAFAGGELAPGLSARGDIQRYQQAARTLLNFLVRRTGGAANRAGFRYVATAKTAGVTFLFKFVFAAADQNFIIEASDNYFRFYRRGARVTVSGVPAYNGATPYVPGDLVVSAGVNYYCIAATTGNAPPNATFWYPLTGTILEIPTPYPAGAFQNPAPLCWSQQGSVVTLTHLNYPPMELVYQGQQRWVLRTISTAPTVAAPAGPGSVAGAAGTRTLSYVITAVDATTLEESVASSVTTIVGAAEGTPAAPNVVSWSAVTGAAEYNVYEDAFANGTFGYIGTATGIVTFRDIGQVPDLAFTPPKPRILFNAANDYPAVSVTHNQRRVFAGTHNARDIVHASRVGLVSNFSRRSPLQDDDAITWRTVSQYLQPVVHLVSLKQLVMLTDMGEWVIQGDADDVLTPTTINPLQQGFVGSAFVTPVVYGEKLLFVQGRGTVLRELSYQERTQGLSGRDLTIFSDHLFKQGKSIVDMDFAMVPDAVVWCVRNDGALLGLTYIPDEDVWGWHRHTTDGSFEQVCAIPEDQEDAVYVVVNRSIDVDGDGDLDTVRYIERLTSRDYADVVDACFLDASVTYDGVATGTITGLSHLRNKVVRVFADGVALAGTFTIGASGAITLPAAASVVHVGLPITCDLESLSLDGDPALRERQKRIIRVGLELEASYRGFQVGPDFAHLRTVDARLWNVNDTPFTGRVELTPQTYFTEHGRVCIRHTDPTPLTVLALLPHYGLGG